MNLALLEVGEVSGHEELLSDPVDWEIERELVKDLVQAKLAELD